MAYPDHYLLSFGGPLHDTELWNMNIRFITSMPVESDDQQDFCTTAKTAIQAWGNSAGSAWSTAAKLSFVKFNRIDPDGTYQDKQQTHRLDFAPVQMKSSASNYPNQTAYVITWTTDFARGPAHLGRVYLPCPSVAVDPASGRVSAANCLSAANAAATFLNDINVQGVPGLGFEDMEASVVSQTNATKARISGVRVGDLLDTQRRRRAQIAEVYTVSVVTVEDMGIAG